MLYEVITDVEITLPGGDRITSYNVCYTKLLRSYFYNTVIWSNTTAGTSSQLKLVTGATVMNCAVDGETAGTNGINISSSNTGTTGGVLYPES